jgi:hypothetical protein
MAAVMERQEIEVRPTGAALASSRSLSSRRALGARHKPDFT